MSDSTLVTLEGVRCLFPMRRSLTDMLGRRAHAVHAVDAISLELRRGEILAIVGESGCGKSTLGRMLVRMQDPTDGRIVFNGTDVTSMSGTSLKDFRRHAQMVFQNPFEAFDPRQTIGQALTQVLDIHKVGTAGERRQRIHDAMTRAGLTPVDAFLARYPHELSGGQSQRVATVRAMLLEPSMLVADEPVSMLDVSVRADILNHMLDLRDRYGMSIVFITHDLAVAHYIADRIAVMYMGMFVELGPSETVVSSPRHPYSRALLSSTLTVGDEALTHDPLEVGGDVPTPVDVKPGCRFANRCPYAFERCLSHTPQLQRVDTGAEVACHLFDHDVAAGTSATRVHKGETATLNL